jgi:hypothetical protein
MSRLKKLSGGDREAAIQAGPQHASFRSVKRIEDCDAKCRVDFDVTFHFDLVERIIPLSEAI